MVSLFYSQPKEKALNISPLSMMLNTTFLINTLYSIPKSSFYCPFLKENINVSNIIKINFCIYRMIISFLFFIFLMWLIILMFSNIKSTLLSWNTSLFLMIIHCVFYILLYWFTNILGVFLSIWRKYWPINFSYFYSPCLALVSDLF